MRKILLFVLILTSSSAYSQFGWYQQNIGTSNDLHGVAFTNDSIGVVIGLGGTVRRTNTGGASWDIISLGLSQSLHKIAVTQSQKWTIIGQNGLLLFSTNRGLGWTIKNSGVNVNLNRIYFIKNNGVASDTGFIAGVGGVFLKTTNGGESWSQIATTTNQNLYCVYFVDQNTGYVAGQSVALKTTNGGDNWVTITPNTSKTYQAMVFKNSNTGIIVGGVGFNDDGIIYRTTNGGVSWTQFTLPIFGAFKAAVYLPNGNINVVGNYTIILNSSDDGLNWSIQTASGNTSELLHDICFIGNNTGYVVGTDGVAFKTTTGGFTGISNISSEIPAYFKLHQNYPNPFNPSTRIKFELPESGNIRLRIFNSLGQEVSELINSNLNAGSYEYNFDASVLSGGVYYYKLSTDNFSEVRKMVLVK